MRVGTRTGFVCEIKCTFNTALLEVMLRLMVQVRVVEHGLGRNAADIQARPAQRAALLDTCRLYAQSASFFKFCPTSHALVDRAVQP